ncbi:MAG: hypothetical protein WDZ80_04215 [Candidatus Paceibacterota bacterium]
MRSRKEKRTTALGFIENKCVTLFSPLIDSVDGLKITYNRKSVNNNLILYQATIYNSGVSDIADTLIYKPLTLKLPDEFVWKSFKIFDKSEGVNLRHSIDGSDLMIEWELFKKEEFFRFDAVIEILNNDSGEQKNVSEKVTNTLAKRISFNDSRISNLQIVRKNIKSYESFLRWGKTLIYYSIVILTLKAMVFDKKDTIVFDVNIDSTSKQVEFAFNSNNEVLLLDSSGNRILVDTLSNDLVISNVKVIQKEDLKFKEKTHPRIMIVLCIIVIILLLEQKRIRNKREKMNLVSPGDWNPYKEEEL